MRCYYNQFLFLILFLFLACNSEPVEQIVISENNLNNQISDTDTIENTSTILKYLENDLGYEKEDFNFTNHLSIKHRLTEDVTTEKELTYLENLFKKLVNEDPRYKNWSSNVIISIKNNLKNNQSNLWYKVIDNTCLFLHQRLKNEASNDDLKTKIIEISNFLSNYKNKTKSDIYKFIHSFINLDLSIYLEFLKHINNFQYRNYLKSLTKLGLLRIKHISNVGNTCYLDSAVIAILWIFIEKKDLFETMLATYIEKKNEEDSILVIFSKIILAAFSTENIDSHLINNLLSAIIKLKPEYRIGKPDDSIQALEIILDSLERNYGNIGSAELVSLDLESDIIPSEKELTAVKNISKKKKINYNNKIYDYFGGIELNNVKCLKCKISRLKYNLFREKIIYAFNPYINKKNTSILEALNQSQRKQEFTQTEYGFKCECEYIIYSEIVSRQETILEYPKNFILRIDRADNGNKIYHDHKLDFPLTTKLGGSSYTLKSVIVYVKGGIGHYYIYIRDINNKWYLFNDLSNDIQEVTKNEVLNANIVVGLIYSRSMQ